MSRRLGLLILLALPVLVFLLLPTLLALSEGVCCYDDASFAVVAKNLAQGRGYLLTLAYQGDDFSGSLFDPALGQGPVGILPVAVAILLFGPGPSVPGLTQVAVEGLLLLLIVFELSRRFAAGRLTAFLTSALAIVLLVSMRHAEQWFAMLGESVAGLLMVLGYLRWCLGGRTVRNAALAGLCFGLAVMTKSIVAVIAVVFFLHAAWQMLRAPMPIVARLRVIAAIAAGGASVFILFEAWKLAVLGAGAYGENWVRYLAFASSRTGIPVGNGGLQPLLARMDAAAASFYLPLPVMLLAAIVVVLVLRNAEEPLRRVSAMLFSGWLAYAVYWLLASSGPTRYLYAGVVVWCFLVALPLLARPWRWPVALPALACIFLAIAGRADTGYRLAVVRDDVFRSPANADARGMLEVLAREPAPKVYTPWWGHVASLEYLAAEPGRFESWHRMPITGTSLVLVNQHLLSLSGATDGTAGRLSELGCVPVETRGNYLLSRCEQPDLGLTPADARVDQLEDGCGFLAGSDFQRSTLPGRRVIGSFIRGDADRATCALAFQPGQSLLYRTGPVVDGLRAEIRTPEGARPLKIDRTDSWRRLEFGDRAGTVTFHDDGAGWGQWLAIALSEPATPP